MLQHAHRHILFLQVPRYFAPLEKRQFVVFSFCGGFEIGFQPLHQITIFSGKKMFFSSRASWWPC